MFFYVRDRKFEIYIEIFYEYLKLDNLNSHLYLKKK